MLPVLRFNSAAGRHEVLLELASAQDCMAPQCPRAAAFRLLDSHRWSAGGLHAWLSNLTTVKGRLTGSGRYC